MPSNLMDTELYGVQPEVQQIVIKASMNACCFAG
jgi:hypothetical protein